MGYHYTRQGSVKGPGVRTGTGVPELTGLFVMHLWDTLRVRGKIMSLDYYLVIQVRQKDVASRGQERPVRSGWGSSQ